MPQLNLIINGYKPPTPDMGGVKPVKRKIWSKNTGRTASGKMVGDIVTRKYEIKVSWFKLSQLEETALDEAIETLSFFPVQFTNQRGEVLTRNFYSDDTEYTQKKYTENDIVYSDISITLVEQ